MPIAKSTSCDRSDSSTDSEVANVNVTEDEEAEGLSSEESEEEEETDTEYPNIQWTGYGKKTPVIVFKPDAIVNKTAEYKSIGEKYHMAYKIVKTECKLVRSVLGAHGFHEVHPNSNDFNVQWTGSHLKPYVLRSLHEFQKVNHFPRSYEITRKDRLFKNVQRMQQTKGFRNFDFVPPSFVIPGEFQDFCAAFLRDKGPWIIKPIASSRGRGIFLVSHPEQVPLDESMIISRYLDNPLTIDGFKFDIRLYVAVTSYDPLCIYLYEEGLTRFATVRYDKSNRTLRNQCMHLTNYSVNKKSNDYVKNDDPDVEDYGNKWSLGAMLRYLRSQGKDTTAMMMRVEDVVIKTLISAELPIATACKMFMPHRGNCFELYGFDILIDDNLRPWVLEVNLSPSLACDSPLDLKIKSNMMTDLFSLTGLICHDPMLRKVQPGRREQPPSRASKLKRPHSASSSSGLKGGMGVSGNLTGEEIRMIRRAKEEYQRRGGWVRIFPSPDSWELYGSFMQFSTTHNATLYQQLYPDRAKNISMKPSTAGYTSGFSRTRNVHLHSAPYPQLHVSTQPGPNGKPDEALAHTIQRTLQYERKLTCLGQKPKKPQNKKAEKASSGAPIVNGKYKGVLVQGVPEKLDKSSSTDKLHKNVTRTTEPINPHGEEKTESSRKSESSTSKSESSTSKSESESSKSVKSSNSGKSVAAVVAKEYQQPVSEMSEPVVKKETPQPTVAKAKPNFNVVKQLEKGRTMSKVQARFAFSMYLMRVQQRLMTEAVDRNLDDVDSANEQMDLVLRFLKRAAGNLQQPFKVVVPSRKLALNDRRRILAKQLGDFVHIYSKETELLRQRSDLEKNVISRRPPIFTQNDGLDEDKFTSFVNTASEFELEEVLTTYTKLNKSASIFLGSNSKSTTEGRVASAIPANSQSDTSLARRKEGSETNFKIRRHHRPQSSPNCTDTGAAAIPHRPASSSYAHAVSIYGAKLNGATSSGRTRPMSAFVHKTQASSQSKNRPMSATTKTSTSVKTLPSGHREQPDGAESNPNDEQSINDALHRLALRQQHRQYAAGRSGIILPAESIRSFPQPLSASPSTEFIPQEFDDDRVSMYSRSTSENTWKSARDTYNDYVSQVQADDELEHAYSRVTGVRPQNGKTYSPTPGSTQFQLLQRDRGSLSDHGDSEQNRALLEKNKRKHQAMVAQAHAAQRATQGSFGSLGLHDVATTTNSVLPPRPPHKPSSNKKPSGHHRMARKSMTEDGQYYGSSTHNSSSGSTQPTFSSGYNNGL